MVKIFGLLVLCAVLFGGGLAGSLYLRSVEKDAGAEGAEGGAGSGGGAGDGASAAADAGAPDLPVAIHSGPISADEVFRFAASIRGRERDLKSRQESIEQQEARLQMMQEDLRGQRRELEGLLGQLQDTLERSSNALEKVQQERRLLQQDKSDAARNLQQSAELKKQDEAIEEANVKKLAEVVSSYDEQFAGTYVRDEVKDGNLRMTARVLSQVEPRRVAKILQNVGDNQVVSALTSELLRLRPPPARKNR